MKQEFGNRIRDLREDMDLNQTKLGKEVAKFHILKTAHMSRALMI